MFNKTVTLIYKNTSQRLHVQALTTAVCPRRRRRRRQTVAAGPDFIVEMTCLNRMVAPKVHLLFILLPAYLEILVALRFNMLYPNNIK